MGKETGTQIRELQSLKQDNLSRTTPRHFVIIRQKLKIKRASLRSKGGVPTVAQWVKDPITMAQVSVEVWVQSLAQHSRLKVSGIATVAAQVIAMAWIQSLTQELPYALGAAIKEKKKKKQQGKNNKYVQRNAHNATL